jgi:hypothetical protein
VVVSMFDLMTRPFEVPMQLFSLGRVFGALRLQRGFCSLFGLQLVGRFLQVFL